MEEIKNNHDTKKKKKKKKKNRPTETELRPTVMTDMLYEILMSLIGSEIENHIAENKIGNFKQAGCPKGGNILDSLFILRE